MIVSLYRFNIQISTRHASVSLFWVVLLQVLCNELDGVGGALFGALGQGLEQDGHHSLVQVLSQGQVLDGGVLSIGGILIAGSSGLVYS